MSETPAPQEDAKPVWRGPAPHSVNGLAYQDNEAEIRAAYVEALESVRELMPRRAELTEKVRYLYGRTEYTLNYDACNGLSDIQKVALAYGGIPPFGGSVRGIRVTVFND
ncbi:hypothetical protein SEA_COLUCCI_50 [Arthrobacter phage Colucci]|uniref:Uncharacterized protein n=1 Tax=Arthrobacter phage Colucci TaxID=2015834 RepID=A0A286N2W3_9CAUD|nr:hypothetical protein FDI27_gp050 [Arthrobacter phage Colucci]ASX98720.1 hypothetical protein SEA_COLUCCI_50 [Arthrobacter phage Colucci]